MKSERRSKVSKRAKPTSKAQTVKRSVRQKSAKSVRSKKAISKLMPPSATKLKKAQKEIEFGILLEGLFGSGIENGRIQNLHTSIPELKAFGLNSSEVKCLLAVLRAEKENFPFATGGAGLRLRLELASAFLSSLIGHSYDACDANGLPDAEAFAQVTIELAVRRAKEIWAQGTA